MRVLNTLHKNGFLLKSSLPLGEIRVREQAVKSSFKRLLASAAHRSDVVG
jgi:hypothetical protein